MVLLCGAGIALCVEPDRAVGECPVWSTRCIRFVVRRAKAKTVVEGGMIESFEPYGRYARQSANVRRPFYAILPSAGRAVLYGFL